MGGWEWREKEKEEREGVRMDGERPSPVNYKSLLVDGVHVFDSGRGRGGVGEETRTEERERGRPQPSKPHLLSLPSPSSPHALRRRRQAILHARPRAQVGFTRFSHYKDEDGGQIVEHADGDELSGGWGWGWDERDIEKRVGGSGRAATIARVRARDQAQAARQG